MTPDVEELYRHLPHAGAMCLIESVTSWDGDSLRAQACGHRRADHPLSFDGRVHGLVAVEYAAQACALHGVLLGRLAASDAVAGATVVATGQRVSLTGGDLDEAGDCLLIEVRCVFRQQQSAVYECRVEDGSGWCCTASLGLIASAAE